MTAIVQTVPTVQTNAAVAKRDTLQTLVDFALSYRKELAFRAAVAGNGSGVVSVPGANRRIYARLGSASGPLAEARVDSFTPANGDTILLRQERVFGLGGWLVVGWLAGATKPCAS